MTLLIANYEVLCPVDLNQFYMPLVYFYSTLQFTIFNNLFCNELNLRNKRFELYQCLLNLDYFSLYNF
jgi:hypothetical protein